MSETENAYIAGLIDGEASIWLAKRSHRPHPIPTIEVSMTDKPTVEFLHRRFGGSFILRRTAGTGLSKKDQWRWRVESAKARAVIEAIRPYVLTRREAVEGLVAQWRSRGLWEEAERP